MDELADALGAEARLIDVREPAEFERMRVPGAVLVPLASVPDRIDAFTEGGPTYVICHSGARSLSACEFVAAHGYEAINVAGGTLAWVESGRPVDSGA